MGNCFICRTIRASNTSKKFSSERAPVEFSKSTSTVDFYGNPSSPFTSYLRFAFLCKELSVNFIPVEPPRAFPVIRIGSQEISGTVEMILHFIDAKYPHPPLLLRNPEREVWEATPCVVGMSVLQHKSMTWHLERLVRWAEDLVARGGKMVGNPEMGTARMEVRKFARSYSELLDVMLEHAQMEERVVFPILEKADRGICKATTEAHGKQFPLMNGIKECIKSIGVMEAGSLDYQEAIRNLSTRLKSLLGHCKELFKEEEQNVLPMMAAVELNKEEQVRVLDQCFDVMQGTHSHLFSFFIDGLLPREALQYMDLIIMCKDEERAASIVSGKVHQEIYRS